jgi:Family of unknown function (DUF5995)
VLANGPAPTAIGGVVDCLTAIDGILKDNDGLKWFNWLYLQITQAVRDALGSATWNDPNFVAELDVDFAALYLSALADYLSNRPGPACWRALFAARRNVRIARVQFAIAGVNAHINHDLAQALVTTSGRLRIPLVHGGPEHTDFDALNPALDAKIAAAESELKILLDGGEIPALNNLETRMAAWSVSSAREAAWTNGEVLSGLQSVPALASRYLQTLDGLAEVINKGLLAPLA